MSVETQRPPTEYLHEEAPPLLHRYLHPRGRLPQPGDVAYCGYVKKSPPMFADSAINRPGYDVCIVCRGLSGRS